MGKRRQILSAMPRNITWKQMLGLIALAVFLGFIAVQTAIMGFDVVRRFLNLLADPEP